MASEGRFKYDWAEIEANQKVVDNPHGKGSSIEDDARFYKIKTNDEGKFIATIRFLPPSQTNKDVVTRIPLFNHWFGEGKKWYVENCPKTIGKPCPACDYTYENHKEYGKDVAKRKNAGKYQKKSYISNILVLDDPQNPENVGKVFLFKYGATILEFLEDAKTPADPEQKPINPFDFYGSGANFRINVYTKEVEGKSMPQYDKCKFQATSKLYDGDDDKIEKVYNSMYRLSAFNEESNFKTYEELKARLDVVLGVESKPKSEDSRESMYSDDGSDSDISDFNSKMDSPKSTPKEEKEDLNMVSEDDDEESFFKKIQVE